MTIRFTSTLLKGAFLALVLFVLQASVALASRGYEEVSVRILDHISTSSFRITPSASIEIRVGDRILFARSGDLIRLKRRGAMVEVILGRKSFTARSVHLIGSRGGTLSVTTGSEAREYAGSLEITSSRSKLLVINHVPLENYVASVVGSEYGLDDIEGAKAMAIAARTYALHAIENGIELKDDERSQVYRGTGGATAASRAAARATAGQVLTFDGKLIDALYSASNGGRTASNSSLWGTTRLPYFKVKKDRWDKRSSHSSWNWSIDKNKLHRVLSDSYGISVRRIKLKKPGADGRIESVELKGRTRTKTISGSAFRATVARHFGSRSLRSTFFSVRNRRGSYAFEGHGFGHGVGLSQWGAHYMAEDGHSFSRILGFYYPGARLSNISTSGSEDYARVEVPVAASAEPAASASLDVVSGVNAIPEENKSLISGKYSAPDASPVSIWNSKSPVKRQTRRSGW